LALVRPVSNASDHHVECTLLELRTNIVSCFESEKSKQRPQENLGDKESLEGLSQSHEYDSKYGMR